MKEYGEIIKRYRKLNNMTQKELASRLGVTDGCISSWEVGRTEPNMGDVEKMSRIFGCTVSDMMGIKKKKDDTAELLALWRNADPVTKEMVMRILRK